MFNLDNFLIYTVYKFSLDSVELIKKAFETFEIIPGSDLYGDNFYFFIFFLIIQWKP